MVLFGKIIEGALNEMENVGNEDKPKYESKYTLKELLDPDFRLPVEKEPSALNALKGMEGRGVKVFRPEE